MIFVATGSLRPFLRLLQEVDALIEECSITERVIVQGGFTHYTPRHFELFDFVSDEKFRAYIKEANVFITHAGSGALFNAIKLEKKIIAVARLHRYGEHVNDHQCELAKKLSEEGYILDGTYSLVETWKKIDTFIPRKCDFRQDVVSNLRIYLNSLQHGI